MSLYYLRKLCFDAEAPEMNDELDNEVTTLMAGLDITDPESRRMVDAILSRDLAPVYTLWPVLCKLPITELRAGVAVYRPLILARLPIDSWIVDNLDEHEEFWLWIAEVIEDVDEEMALDLRRWLLPAELEPVPPWTQQQLDRLRVHLTNATPDAISAAWKTPTSSNW